MSKKQKDTTPAVKPGARRRTIGYIARYLADKNTYTVWQGVIDAASEQDVNVISLFPSQLVLIQTRTIQERSNFM